jgi:hypothetical protein
MDWIQLVTFVGTIMTVVGATAALFIWAVSESREDHRENRAELARFREAWSKESKDFNERWLQEKMEFHQRLCQIEAARK